MDVDPTFDALFEVEYPAIVQELTILLGTRAGAEDVAGDAFEQLLRKWSTVRNYDRPGAWVRHVAFRLAGRARWRHARRQAVEANNPPSRDETNADLDLKRALAQLPHKQRASIVLHYFADLPAAEIGQVLGCSEATVRTHLFRGRARLNSLLAETAAEEMGEARVE